jgi:membrane associated rhomboid family serine protease
MPSLAESVGKELKTILVFVGILWAMYLLSLVWPSVREYGLRPRTASGLVGIFTMPLLHANLRHIVANTIPLVVLLFLLAGSRARSWMIALEIIVLSGVMLWLFGRRANHIGASALISGLIAFLILGGVFERRAVPIIVAVVTFALYGGSLLWGVIPRAPGVSWEGHLFGAIAGGLLAFQLAHPMKARAGVEAACLVPLLLMLSASSAFGPASAPAAGCSPSEPSSAAAETGTDAG